MARYTYAFSNGVYNDWHRKHEGIAMIDIDSVEIRKVDGCVQPVALVETGRWNRSRFKSIQKDIIMQIADTLGIGCFFVEYSINLSNNSLNKFKVTNLKDGSVEFLSNEEYKIFIIKLKEEIKEC